MLLSEPLESVEVATVEAVVDASDDFLSLFDSGDELKKGTFLSTLADDALFC